MLVDDFLSTSARLRADRPALVVDGRRWSYGELDRRVNRLARALRDAGVGREDRVVICLPNSLDAVVSIFASLRADAAFVVLNPTTREKKFSFLLADCGARAAIVPREWVEGVSAAVHTPGLRALVTCGEGPDPPAGPGVRELRMEEWIASFSGDPPCRQAIDIDLAGIIYTSGSTGRPKGVVVTHRNVLSAADSITTYLENVPEDVILSVLPLSFDYGLYQALMAAKVGATLVLEKSFAYPFQVVRRVQEERVTGFPGVPTIFATLLRMADLDPALFDTVRYVTNTAAALPPAHITALRRLFRRARLYSMYGVTECKRVSYLTPDELDRRPESVGRGMPNEEVWIADEKGIPLGPGQVGELVVRGANVMQGYWGLPEETAKALRPGRHPWEKVLYTGDLFRMDEEGYLYFFSRTDDTIKSRGEKVSPREVEAVIYELPDVKETAVAGEPDPILGQAVVAYVVLVPGSPLTAKDILRHLAGRLENYLLPSRIEFREALPRTDSGKVRPPPAGKAAATAVQTCSRCVLPSTFPGIGFDTAGVCSFCRQTPAPEAQEDHRREALAKFTQVADSVRNLPGPHCLLALSGGKDSSYTLLTLREQFGLRVIAVTFDNGFMSHEALLNAHRVVEAADADHLLVKPRFSALRSVFARAARDDSVFPPKALERASGVCNACMALVKGTLLRIALERAIPILAYGWSPGQAPLSAAVFRLNSRIVRLMFESTIAPVLALSDDTLADHLPTRSQIETATALPVSVNPLAFLKYEEAEIFARIRRAGWMPPTDTDANSTNCRLNAFANHVHLARHGYHPYAAEISGLVREGALSREEGLQRTSGAGRGEVIREVARRLGAADLLPSKGQ